MAATQELIAQKWDGVFRRDADLTIRSINEEERSVEIVASTDTIDSHGDIVEQTFKLGRYKKNPVVLWMHNRFGFLDGSDSKDYFPVGRGEGTKVEDGKLVTKIFFGSKEYNENAERCWLGFKERILRAVSIGFRPGKVDTIDDNGKKRFKLRENELFEISVVPIPSNPDAVAKGHDDDGALIEKTIHALERDVLRRMAEPEPTGREAAEDSNMDAKLLQETLDKANAELKSEREAHDKSKAELAVTTAKLADAEKRIKELEGKAEGLELKAKELGDGLAAANEKIKGFEAEAEKASAAKAEADVDALVGVKIAPAAREKWLKLRKSDEKQFNELVADLPERTDLKQIIPPKTKQDPEGGPARGADDSLMKEADEYADED